MQKPSFTSILTLARQKSRQAGKAILKVPRGPTLKSVFLSWAPNPSTWFVEFGKYLRRIRRWKAVAQKAKISID